MILVINRWRSDLDENWLRSRRRTWSGFHAGLWTTTFCTGTPRSSGRRRPLTREVCSTWTLSSLPSIHSRLPGLVPVEMSPFFRCPFFLFLSFQVRFVTRIYHPNVKSDSGEICADIINNGWGPTLNALYVLNTIRSVRNRTPLSIRSFHLLFSLSPLY